jgi:hypothetical protein
MERRQTFTVIGLTLNDPEILMRIAEIDPVVRQRVIDGRLLDVKFIAREGLSRLFEKAFAAGCFTVDEKPSRSENTSPLLVDVFALRKALQGGHPALVRRLAGILRLEPDHWCNSKDGVRTIGEANWFFWRTPPRTLFRPETGKPLRG